MATSEKLQKLLDEYQKECYEGKGIPIPQDILNRLSRDPNNPRLKIHDVDKFKQRILDHSGSVNKFAKDSGACTETTIRRAIANGYISLDIAKKISKYLGITLHELLECDSYEPSPVLTRSILDDISDALSKLFGFEEALEEKPAKKKKRKKKKKKKSGKKGK